MPSPQRGLVGVTPTRKSARRQPASLKANQASGSADDLNADNREDDASETEDHYCSFNAFVVALLAFKFNLLSCHYQPPNHSSMRFVLEDAQPPH